MCLRWPQVRCSFGWKRRGYAGLTSICGRAGIRVRLSPSSWGTRASGALQRHPDASETSTASALRRVTWSCGSAGSPVESATTAPWSTSQRSVLIVGCMGFIVRLTRRHISTVVMRHT